MGYCTVDDVGALFPDFKRNALGSVSDAQIQTWIDTRAARIRSTLLLRNIDPATLVLTTDQANLLKIVNVDGAAADLADTLQLRIAVAGGEVALADAHRKTYERVLGEIARGIYDPLFGMPSRVVGNAGGDMPAGQTPADTGENKAFGKNVKY